MKNKNFYIHLGMAKSASSYLQTNIFPFLPNHHYINLFQENILSRTFYDIIFHFEDPEILIEKNRDNILRFLNNIKEKGIIFSYEGLIGCPENNFILQKRLLKALKIIFQKAQLLLIIRKQDDIIESFYRQNLRMGLSGNIDRYINFDKKTDNFLPFHYYERGQIDIRSIDYNVFYQNICDFFEKEDITIIPFELVKKNNEDFINQIATFLEIDDIEVHITDLISNKSFGYYSCLFLSIYNYLVKTRFYDNGIISFEYTEKSKVIKRIINKISIKNKIISFLDKYFSGKKKFMNKKKRELIMKLHSQSNKELSQFLKFDLGKFDYY